MAKQEVERDHNLGQKEQNGHLKPEDVFKAFETLGAQFQEIEERKNPKLLSIKGSINGECELLDGRVAEITWTRNHENYSPETTFTSGWIIVRGEDLRQQGIRRVGYKFGREFNKDGSSTPFIIKTTLQNGDSIAHGEPLNTRDGQELSQVNASIKELSAKFPPLPEKNKVVLIGKETKVPKGSIFEPLKQIFNIK